MSFVVSIACDSDPIDLGSGPLQPATIRVRVVRVGVRMAAITRVPVR
jgi:hypothetical protein